LLYLYDGILLDPTARLCSDGLTYRSCLVVASERQVDTQADRSSTAWSDERIH